jgi:RNA polymerase sigma factor (sigma-70 family)
MTSQSQQTKEIFEQVKDLYVNQKLKPKKISKSLGVNRNTLNGILASLNSGCNSVIEYQNNLAKKRGFDSYSQYVTDYIKQNIDFNKPVENSNNKYFSKKIAVTCEHPLIKEERDKIIHSLISKLVNPTNDKRLIQIVYYRFFENKTLEEIGQIYGISRQGIKQLEKKALNHIAQLGKKYHLEDYYGK